LLVVHVAVLYYLVSLSYTSPASSPAAKPSKASSNDKELAELLREEQRFASPYVASNDEDSIFDTDADFSRDEPIGADADIEALFPSIYQRFLNEQNLINEYIRSQEATEELPNEEAMFSDPSVDPLNDVVKEKEDVKEKDGFKVLEKDKIIKSKGGNKISKIHSEEGMNKEGNAQFKKINFVQNEVYTSDGDNQESKHNTKGVVAPAKVHPSPHQAPPPIAA